MTGYGPLIERLADPVRADIRLGAVASVVRWRDGEVEVVCRDAADEPLETFVARAVVVSVPAGVLAAANVGPGAIRFDPPVPTAARAIELTAMGAVVRLVLRFRHAFWRDEKLADRLSVLDLDQMSFIQSRQPMDFPVLWTTYPVASPVIIAWTGGPRASALARLAVDDLTRRAVQSLAAIFGLKPAMLRRELVATYHHDWINDPFARGAYSYARVGGANACERLSRPISRTIWFAGEAADRLGRTGTVHGAIDSGWRAADEIIRRA